MKSFILPGFMEKYQLNKGLIDIYEKYPEKFVDNFQIECFFGNFYLMPWEGGRVFFEDVPRVFYEDIVAVRDFYNEKGYPIRLTCTNPVITEEGLTDPFANLILSLLHNGQNQVLVSSDLLEEYIRETYPNYGIVSSTTKCLTSKDDAKLELNNPNYIQHCLDYNLNHNKELLTNLSQEEKDKVEFLCNAICPPGCPRRKEHYRRNGISMMNAGSSYHIDCHINSDTIYLQNKANQLSPEEIAEYEKMGFSHFKLEGRTLFTEEVIHNYLKYMIKPEYYIDVSHALFAALRKN